MEFLKALHQKWLDEGLLGDTSNPDFTTIPYRGNGDHLENNWSENIPKGGLLKRQLLNK